MNRQVRMIINVFYNHWNGRRRRRWWRHNTQWRQNPPIFPVDFRKCPFPIVPIIPRDSTCRYKSVLRYSPDLPHPRPFLPRTSVHVVHHPSIMEDQVCLSSTLHSSLFLSPLPLPFLQLVQLELLCHQLYESSDIATRRRAEKTLVAFSESPNSLPQCQILLENSQVYWLIFLYEYITIFCSLHMHCYWLHQHSLN